MKEFFKTDIKDKNEFLRIGYKYTKVYADDVNHIYLYKMEKIDKELQMPYPQYELVKAKKAKQPDGTDVYMYPSDEDWGKYGWTIMGKEEQCQETIRAKMAALLNH